MGWYIFISSALLLIIILTAVARAKHINMRRVALKASCLVLFAFMALRSSSVGSDTISYCQFFLDQKLSSMEPGYAAYNSFLRFFFSDPQVITVANSAVIILLLYINAKNLSPLPLLSIWLYVTLGLYQSEMNTARNAMAIMLCFFATRYIDSNNPIKYISVIAIASTIHLSSIIFFPLFWISRHWMLSLKRLAVILASAVVIYINITILSPYLLPLMPAKYQGYVQSAMERSGGVFEYDRIAFEFLIIALCAYILVKIDRREINKALNIDRTGSWLMILSAFFTGFSAYGNRLAAVFSPYIIFYVPRIIVTSVHPEKKQRNLILSISVLAAIQYIIRMTINNIGKTMPYSFFWS